MKVPTIAALLVLGLTSQAMAGPGAEATPKLNPGVTPELAQKHVPKYDIVTSRVVKGVKFSNPAAATGFDPEPDPPGQAGLMVLPSR